MVIFVSFVAIKGRVVAATKRASASETIIEPTMRAVSTPVFTASHYKLLTVSQNVTVGDPDAAFM